MVKKVRYEAGQSKGVVFVVLKGKRRKATTGGDEK